MDVSASEPYPSGDGTDPFSSEFGNDPFPSPPPRPLTGIDGARGTWATMQALLTPAAAAAQELAQSAAQRMRAAALELAESDAANSAALALRDAARDVADRLERMTPPSSPAPTASTRLARPGVVGQVSAATSQINPTAVEPASTLAPGPGLLAMEPSTDRHQAPPAAQPPGQQVFANTPDLSVRVVILHAATSGELLVWAGYQIPQQGQRDSLELPGQYCSPAPTSEQSIRDIAQTCVRDQLGATMAPTIQILGRLPGDSPGIIRRQLFVVGILASAPPNNIIPEFRNRADTRYNGYAWIRHLECRPSATTQMTPGGLSFNLRNGHYSLPILPVGTQRDGTMRRTDVEALGYFWEDIAQYAQSVTFAPMPTSVPMPAAHSPPLHVQSPPPHVQFQRGSLMPPPVIPTEADTPPRQLAFPHSPHQAPISILRRTEGMQAVTPGARDAAACDPQELEQQIALLKDQHAIELRNLEAAMQNQIAAEVTRRLNTMGPQPSAPHASGSVLRDNFQRGVYNLLPERVQSYFNVPAPSALLSAAAMVSPTQTEHAPVPQYRRRSYELPSTSQPVASPRMPSQQPAPRPASVIDPRHQEYHKPVVVVQSQQQTGRFCFYSGHREESTSTKLNARDFMKSFEVIRATQFWTEQESIAECKARCHAKLDDQLATFKDWERFGWEAWKAKFIDHFRHILEDQQKMDNFLSPKCDGPVATFNAHFEQLINEVRVDLCEGAPCPDAILRHIYLRALPKDLRSQAAPSLTADKKLFDIMQLCAQTEYYTALPSGTSGSSPKDKSRENFNSITKEATAKIVEAINTQTLDEEALITKIMTTYERVPGDAALAFKLTAEERDRRKKHNLCFNEECKGQYEHNFREREKCLDPARRALASKQPRQTRFGPRQFRRPSSPAASLNRASGGDGETSEDGGATEGEDSDAFDPDAAHGL